MSIDKMVTSFDDVDGGIAYLKSSGKIHSKLDAFTPEMFVVSNGYNFTYVVIYSNFTYGNL